jgi:hypothetical protein
MSVNLQLLPVVSMIYEWLNNAKSIDVDGYREILGVFHVISIRDIQIKLLLHSQLKSLLEME